MTPKEGLQAARKLIEKPENWGRGNYRRRKADGTICYCLEGALLWAGAFELGYSPVYQKVEDAVSRFKAAHPGHGYNGIVDFNDRDFITHADVLAVLDDAIAHAE